MFGLTELFFGPWIILTLVSSSFILTVISLFLILFAAYWMLDDFYYDYEGYTYAAPAMAVLGVLFTVSFLFMGSDGWLINLIKAVITIFSYFIYGVIALPVIWFLAKRAHIELTLKTKDKFNALPEKDQTEEKWINLIYENGLNTKRWKFPSAKTRESIPLMFKYVSLWPIYLIDMTIGGFIREIPNIISRFMGGTLDAISNFAGKEAETPQFLKTQDNN